MRIKFHHVIIIPALAAMSACSAHTQLSSGQAYLDRFPDSAQTIPGVQSDLDAQVRDIAAIEPDLVFPAKIGLARIQGGKLINTPEKDMEIWAEFAANLGADTGSFVPVSPFIAAMVRPKDAPNHGNAAIADIRRASARQHIDYVLAYEITDTTSNEANALSLGNLTVLGLFILPSRDVKIDSTASAIFMDVRNGYPYATASSFAEKKTLTTAYGSGAQRQALSASTKQRALKKLTVDLETAFLDLKRQSMQQGAQQSVNRIRQY